MKKIYIFVLLLLISKGAIADEQKVHNLEIERLNDVYVTSASKKEEPQFKSTTAIYVVTQEDIKRSGATSIPEVLRYVPGINVARVDSNKWAISARGFTRQYSNKLLVLVDGRSIYNPLVSGVFWDTQDMILQDIDRIEVIRGPGASLWGSNAVNGVINIITKKAQTTQGYNIELITGNHEKGTVSLRYGGKYDDVFFRAYLKAIRRDELRAKDLDTGNNDSYSQYKSGFRADIPLNYNEEVTLLGNVFYGKSQQDLLYPGLINPSTVSRVDGDETYNGINLTGNWEKKGNNTAHFIKSYIDFNQRDSKNLLNQRTLTFDVEYQQNRKLSEKNEVTWGLGYRFIDDDIKGLEVNGKTYLFYDPISKPRTIYNAYMQNQLSIIPDTLDFITGIKVEHNKYTGFEVQPNVRLGFYPSQKNTFWAAVSRAVRTPTRGERGLSSIALSTPGGFLRLSSDVDRSFESENLTAYEVGHRYKASPRVTIDTALHYSVYDDLRTFEPGVSEFGIPGTVSELIARNYGFARTFGAEIAAKVIMSKNWSLEGNYTYIKLNMGSISSSNDVTIASEEGKTPQHNFSLLSRVNVKDNLQFDTNLKFVDELEAFNIPAYIKLDARIGWKLREGVEVSLTGQNLLDSAHPEFQPFLFTPPAEVGRGVFLKLNLNF